MYRMLIPIKVQYGAGIETVILDVEDDPLNGSLKSDRPTLVTPA
jgi:hypothetical protein